MKILTIECSECGGSGDIDAESIDGYIRSEECPRCQGEGRVTLFRIIQWWWWQVGEVAMLDTLYKFPRVICVFFGHKFAAPDNDAWYRECERCHEVLP